MKNPDQPIVIAEDKVVRFKENKIISKLLVFATENGYSLNNIAIDFDTEVNEKDNADAIQLMQLIGYSVSGYGGLSCVKYEDALNFDRRAKTLVDLTN
ncbi:MAG: hypothetical protein GY775_18955 [Candidatus Scalindua sp.]|nr:hypothetical protein [Candidatus Scalindua sp.]